MIRIYLDWNIISNLKKPEFKEIDDYIRRNKNILLFPYSPAHFTDLMKSNSDENFLFAQDLEELEYLSGKHLIRWGKNGIEPLFATPKEYFESEKDKENIISLLDIESIFKNLDDPENKPGLDKVGTLLINLMQSQPAGIEINKENKLMANKMFPNTNTSSSMWDLMKDISSFQKKLLFEGNYYKDFRKSIADQGMKIDSNSGNWDHTGVIRKIDEYLLSTGSGMTFLEYVEAIFKIKNEPVSKYDYYIAAYLMLDMLGYKKDKLSKPINNMQNTIADAEHSFYGAHCDFFVAIDNNLRSKSKVLYNQFNISTKIIEPEQLISELDKVKHEIPDGTDFLSDAVSYCIKENLVESSPLSENIDVESYAFKLPRLYFNFFNYVIYSKYPERDLITFTFRKVFKNLSGFIYFTESESLVDNITDYFGYENKEELENKKREFVQVKKDAGFVWNFQDGMIVLENETDTTRPALIYIISTQSNDK